MKIANAMLGPGIGGLSIGHQSTNLDMSALGGALQGCDAGSSLASSGAPRLSRYSTIALPVIGAVVGAVGGLIGGILGARNKVKQARRELEKQMNDISHLLYLREQNSFNCNSTGWSSLCVSRAIAYGWESKNALLSTPQWLSEYLGRLPPMIRD